MEDSVVEAGLVVSVVVGGLVAAGLAAGSVVSVFCSHAARSAAPARMQMYFFIVVMGSKVVQSTNGSKAVLLDVKKRPMWEGSHGPDSRR